MTGQETQPAAIPDKLWQNVEGAWTAKSQADIRSLIYSIALRVVAKL